MEAKLEHREHCGACGAGIGVGIATSVLTGATPLTGQPRRLANEATAFALARMQDGYPRCCKRVSRQALAAACEFLATRLGLTLAAEGNPGCTFVARNRECVRKSCPYHLPAAQEGDDLRRAMASSQASPNP